MPASSDVGVLSKLPLGGLTSWQHEVHPADPARPVFARDLLEVEVFNSTRRRRLFTLYNNHLTSQFIDPGEDPAIAGAAKPALAIVLASGEIVPPSPSTLTCACRKLDQPAWPVCCHPVPVGLRHAQRWSHVGVTDTTS